MLDTCDPFTHHEYCAVDSRPGVPARLCGIPWARGNPAVLDQMQRLYEPLLNDPYGANILSSVVAPEVLKLRLGAKVGLG